MLVPDRRRRMLELVRRSGSARAAALAEELGVSPWTVRRDLAELERQGLLLRARGGALVEAEPPVASPDAPAVEGTGPDARQAKARIAAAAVDRLVDGSTVMLLSGSTTGAVVPLLQRRRLTVVTNGIETAYALRHAPDVSLVVLGGYLHREQMTLLGPMTERAMGDLHVDVIVAGAYGVSPDVGITGQKIIQAGYHHRMLRHSDALMVLADASKFGRQGPTVLAALDDVDILITDDDVDTDIARTVGERVRQLVVV